MYLPIAENAVLLNSEMHLPTFIITCSTNNGPDTWTVSLGRAFRPYEYRTAHHQGRGATPELAYTDMLRKTALELHNRGY